MLEWNERYHIGVQSIDSAHQELFAVINRVHKMVRMGGNIKWSVAEAIKYFKCYTIKHFADEEKFMRQIGYTGLQQHHEIHTGMREKIIPKLYSHLEFTEYSEEAVRQFLRIAEKWLDTHILGHDRELIKWVPNAEC